MLEEHVRNWQNPESGRAGALVVQERTLHHRLARRRHLREGVKANRQPNVVRGRVQYDQLVELELEAECVCKHVVHLPLV